MVDSAPGLFGFSSIIIWLTVIVVSCGLLGLVLILFLKNAMRRRLSGLSSDARRATKVVDAWVESAKRMDGSP
jgi:hypothetical protein